MLFASRSVLEMGASSSSCFASPIFDGDVKPTKPFEHSFQNVLNSTFWPGINVVNGNGEIVVSHGETDWSEKK
jgi:hypothetical protein